MTIKHILKYLRRTRDYMLVYHCIKLLSLEYTNSNFQSGRNFRKSTFGFVFTLGGRVISWRSVKQSYIVDFIIEVEYIIVSEATKEVFWLRKFLMGLGIVPLAVLSLVLFCDNNGMMAQSKEPKNHRKDKHIKKKYQLIHEMVMKRDVSMEKIISQKNLVNHFTKILSTRVFDGHRDSLGVKCVPSIL